MDKAGDQRSDNVKFIGKIKKFCPFCGSKLTKKHAEGLNRLWCATCCDPVYENPVPAACAVALDKDLRLLLVKRSVPPQKGFWCLPGGFMELFETPEKTALRELEEETGLKGKIELLLGVSSNQSELYDTVLLVCYLMREFSGKAYPGDDAEDIGWFSKDDLPEIAFVSHARFIRIAFAAYV